MPEEELYKNGHSFVTLQNWTLVELYKMDTITPDKLDRGFYFGTREGSVGDWFKIVLCQV